MNDDSILGQFQRFSLEKANEYALNEFMRFSGEAHNGRTLYISSFQVIALKTEERPSAQMTAICITLL